MPHDKQDLECIKCIWFTRLNRAGRSGFNFNGYGLLLLLPIKTECNIFVLNFQDCGWRLFLLLLIKKERSSFVWNSQGAVFFSHWSEWLWFADCRHIFYFPQKKRHVQRKTSSQPRSSKLAAQHIYRQMYFVHLYGLHVNCALVDLDSSGSLGVRPTPELISSTLVVCVCVRAYTSTHPPTTLRPTKTETYTRQTPHVYPCQNIPPTSVTSVNNEQAEKKTLFQSPTTHVCRCW